MGIKYMKKYSFEKLVAWQLSKDFTKNIYGLVKKFPKSEAFGISDQLKRAALSVPTNLAEGSGRKTGKDKAYFTQIAYSSLMECLSLLIIASELGYISITVLEKLREDIEIISVKLSNLRNSQYKSK